MLGVAGVVGLVTSAAPSLFGRASTPPSAGVARLLLDVGPAEELRSAVSNARIVTPGGSRTAFAWTPDGRTLVFAGRAAGVQQLFARSLDRDEGQPLKGTLSAEAPAVSTDGAWVAFWANGAIKKVGLAGGPVTDLAAPVDRPPVGMVWDDAGNLFFGNTDGRIWVVRAGGELAAVTARQDGEWRQILPWPLPGGKVLLYTARKQETGWRGDEVVALALGTGERKILLRDADDARYVPTGHLVFLRRGMLYGVAFDADRLELKGRPAPLIDGVAQALEVADYSGAGQFAIGAGGRLAWLRGMPRVGQNRRLVSVDRRGSLTPAKVTPGPLGFTVRLSPEGRRAALFLDGLAGRSLWVYDLERGTPTPLNQEGDSGYAAHWSPDGRRVAYRWIREGRANLVWQRADGTGKPEVLAAGTQLPVSWMPDGRGLLAVSGEGGAHVWDFWLATWAGGPFAIRRLTDGPTYRHSPELSPDGKWLAYVARTQSSAEVYVQPFPSPGPAVQVSLEGGFSPAWRRDGRELFFASPDPRLLDVWHMMSVPISPTPHFRAGTPRRLFDFTPDLSLGGYPMRVYDVSPDGERFYATQELTRSLPPSPPVTHVQIIENWFEELRAKAPPGR
jgi:serine/threonine-protein kinase